MFATIKLKKSFAKRNHQVHAFNTKKKKNTVLLTTKISQVQVGPREVAINEIQSGLNLIWIVLYTNRRGPSALNM